MVRGVMKIMVKRKENASTRDELQKRMPCGREQRKPVNRLEKRIDEGRLAGICRAYNETVSRRGSDQSGARKIVAELVARWAQESRQGWGGVWVQLF